MIMLQFFACFGCYSIVQSFLFNQDYLSVIPFVSSWKLMILSFIIVSSPIGQEVAESRGGVKRGNQPRIPI